MNAGRLWAGGLATAAVAALTAVAGIVLIRGLLRVPVVGPDTLTYALGAGAVALAATALLHSLALTTPRYGRFFTWIMALGTTIATTVPLSLGVPGSLASAVLNLVLGIAITTTLSAVGRTAIRR